jgi:hypothetical protein
MSQSITTRYSLSNYVSCRESLDCLGLASLPLSLPDRPWTPTYESYTLESHSPPDVFVVTLQLLLRQRATVVLRTLQGNTLPTYIRIARVCLTGQSLPLVSNAPPSCFISTCTQTISRVGNGVGTSGMRPALPKCSTPFRRRRNAILRTVVAT